MNVSFVICFNVVFLVLKINFYLSLGQNSHVHTLTSTFKFSILLVKYKINKTINEFCMIDRYELYIINLRI